MATENRRAGRVRRAWYAPALAAALLGAGCGERDEPPFGRHKVELQAVPEPVMKAAHKELPQITFEDAWENLDPARKVVSYEIRGRAKNGKIREVRVSTTGKVLELE
jgi:hypothetical protein